MNIKQILEWYGDAGVDETCGGVPFAMDKPVEKVVSNLRQATTELAQSGVTARQNARDICDKIDDLDDLRNLVESFDGCALKLTASKTVFGDGNREAKIMIIGEAPGADEDRAGLPFVGRGGQMLDKMLKTIKIERARCYLTNVLPWRPPGNRTPTDGEIAVCLPFLKRQIDLVNPELILVLGGSAANAILEIQEPISKLRGHWLEYKKSNGEKVPVIASFHPTYLLRNAGQKAKAWSDLLRLSKKII